MLVQSLHSEHGEIPGETGTSCAAPVQRSAAAPKSMILMLPPAVIRMLSGFTSLCTMPAAAQQQLCLCCTIPELFNEITTKASTVEIQLRQSSKRRYIQGGVSAVNVL